MSSCFAISLNQFRCRKKQEKLQLVDVVSCFTQAGAELRNQGCDRLPVAILAGSFQFGANVGQIMGTDGTCG